MDEEIIHLLTEDQRVVERDGDVFIGTWDKLGGRPRLDRFFLAHLKTSRLTWGIDWMSEICGHNPQKPAKLDLARTQKPVPKSWAVRESRPKGVESVPQFSIVRLAPQRQR